MKIRRCSRCDKEFPLNAEFWAWDVDEKNHSKICIICHQEITDGFNAFQSDSDMVEHQRQLKSLKTKPSDEQLDRMERRFDHTFFNDMFFSDEFDEESDDD